LINADTDTRVTNLQQTVTKMPISKYYNSHLLVKM